MSRSSSAATHEQVLIHAAFGRDSGMIADVLKQVNIDARICEGVNVLLSELRSGAGAILIADEALNSQNVPYRKF